MSDLFDLKAGYVTFKNPVAVASMAGITDSGVFDKFHDAGLYILGGYSIDEAAMGASKEMVKRGRKEFISDDVFNLIESELKKVSGKGVAIGINVRATSTEPFLRAAELAKKYGAIIEINAHCRQEEMVALGIGEAMLKDRISLARLVSEAKKTGAVISLKMRSGVVDDVKLCRTLEKAGLDIIHVDAVGMRGANLNAIKKIRDSTSLFIIGNNSIVNYESAQAMLSAGSDMISVARAAMSNPKFISGLVSYVEEQQRQTGWYNAPSHICRGGDLRGLTWCCPPIKDCPVHGALARANLSPEKFARIKLNFGKGTKLERGSTTCFGSMVWCCKFNKPCYLREESMAENNLDYKEYTLLKKKLSEEIIRNIDKDKVVT
ncbi:putative methanogenesis marker domain 9 [Methanocella conradii HZ254]|uniref:Methanogenesis marker domain 9 n=1 Tax=Methanocella conradii (strain DSM 24694 / JCM 17849 / CGMCC 1.5162 / HZ254) TaxID=1041930 RepID=H8I617_METCZ|nr:methanogenesis marker 9 domain-containing protein [Methanocella conradii]AFD00251.1 putative methanogenesis marker domain 9 [Methanocella conradii HZ254]